MVWAFELIAVTVWLDTRELSQGRFLALLGDWGPGILRAFVTTAAICLAFAYTRFERLPPLGDAPISWKLPDSACGRDVRFRMSLLSTFSS